MNSLFDAVIPTNPYIVSEGIRFCGYEVNYALAVAFVFIAVLARVFDALTYDESTNLCGSVVFLIFARRDVMLHHVHRPSLAQFSAWLINSQQSSGVPGLANGQVVGASTLFTTDANFEIGASRSRNVMANSVPSVVWNAV